MTEGNMNVVIAETDITALKEALGAQQQLLQKLYAELDVEREASATAVSEALSMILRLQEEKSAVLMEANQYKRMTEEKISHAEESMANFEELMYQKEMEIASLEFQVQAYKCKLLSMGCSDVGEMGETKFENNLLLPGNNNNDAMIGETGAIGHVRRLKSLPPLQLKDSSQSRRRKRSMTPEPDMVIKIMEQTSGNHEMNDQSSDLKKNQEKFEGGDLDSYWEQIRKLDERVKEITDRSTSLKVESRTSSLVSQSLSSIYDAGRTVKTKGDQVKDLKMRNEKDAIGDSACSSSVYDVFEVPQVNESSKNCLKEKEQKIMWFWGEENSLGKPDLGMKGTSESHVNNESELVKKLLLANQDKGLCRPREGSIDCNVAIVQPEFNITEFQQEIQEPSQRIERVAHESASTSHDIAAQREEELHLLSNNVVECGPEFQQLRQRIEQLEANRNVTRHEIIDEGREELILLREIREQINSLHDEIRCWRRKKPSPHNDPSILSLQEAMLHFWL